MTSTERRWSSSSNHSENVKFPDLYPPPKDHLTIYEEGTTGSAAEKRTLSPNNYPRTNGIQYSERWQARKENYPMWSNGHVHGPAGRHGRQQSLSDAIKNIRTRKGSVTVNAHEIAEALKAPVSYQLIVWTRDIFN